jgi:hypothetical protein
MILVRHRLGKSSLIDQLRVELQKHQERFPILLQKVLYTGTHTCDWIPFEQIPQLTEEIKNLKAERWQGPAAEAVRHFKIQMAELIIAAKESRKPICF